MKKIPNVSHMEPIWHTFGQHVTRLDSVFCGFKKNILEDTIRPLSQTEILFSPAQFLSISNRDTQYFQCNQLLRFHCFVSLFFPQYTATPNKPKVTGDKLLQPGGKMTLTCNSKSHLDGGTTQYQWFHCPMGSNKFTENQASDTNIFEVSNHIILTVIYCVILILQKN